MARTLKPTGRSTVRSCRCKRIKVKVDTLCVHGDEASGVAVARGIRSSLEEAGIAVVPLPDMKL